jgi:hydrogenase maturation protease
LNSDSGANPIIPPHPPLARGGEGDFSDEKSSAPLSVNKDEGDVSPVKIVILCVGNVLLSDEGVGVHVAHELIKTDLPSNVSVVEGGTDGFRLIDIITEADRLIVVDAVRGGDEPGSLYRFDIDDVKHSPEGFKTSVHQIGILEVIDLSELIGKKPHTTVIGIEPKSLEMSMELTPEIQEKIPRIIELVREEINRSF